MKWLAFTSACVAALVLLGILAVDERDVIWEGRQPQCGYCRSSILPYAVVCPVCDRSLDWRPAREECRWCLDRHDADHIKRLYEEIDEGKGPVPEALAEYGTRYFDSIDVGACTYCGGIGSVADGNGKKDCPVCRGDQRCIACGGTRSVVVGDEAARRQALERTDARERAEARARMVDLPLNDGLLLDGDVAALRGHAEAEGLRDEKGNSLLELARARVTAAVKALHAEHARRAKERAGSSGS
jgi:hypothetical protein